MAACAFAERSGYCFGCADCKPCYPVQRLRRLLAWFAARPPEPRARRRPGFDPLDTERIQSELGVQAEARRMGRSNIPPPDARALCAVESKLVQAVDRSRHAHVGWARERLDVLNQAIAAIDLEPLALRVFAAAESYEHRAAALLETRASVLERLAASLRAREDELEGFKRRNGLAREAHFPAPTLRVLLLALLAALVLIEALLNAFFFAPGLDSGILGGWVHAAAFSAANVLCAYGLGRYGLPEWNHASWRRKLVGALCAALALVSATLIALLLGHVRDALSLQADAAAAGAIARFAAEPFGLQSVQSWILFGLSMLCALVAMLDAYRLDDPYPGYGKLARRVHGAREDYDEEMADTRARLEALKDASLEEIERTLELAANKVHRLHESIELKVSTEMRLRNALRDDCNGLEALLRAFRDENRLARTAPAPAYFHATPALPPLDAPSFDTTADRQRLEALRARLAQMRAHAVEARTAILASYNRRRAGVIPLDQHFPLALGSRLHEAARA